MVDGIPFCPFRSDTQFGSGSSTPHLLDRRGGRLQAPGGGHHLSEGLWFTRCRTPDLTWAQLLPRDDDQIGVQEALAVLLLQATFSQLCAGALVTVLVDNDGVSYAFIMVTPMPRK